MIPILCLALVAQGPRIEGARGRVLLLDAESGARRVASGACDAPMDGVLETGAASSARVSIAGRMALELEGPSSFEWRGQRQQLLRVAMARWDWRGAHGELDLPRGWSLRGGPGAYELVAESDGYVLRNLAGAPIEVLDGGSSVLLVQPGGSGRFGRPRVESSTPEAWQVHEWPWQATMAEQAREPRLWWPASFACADVEPPRHEARVVEPIAAPRVRVEPKSPASPPEPEGLLAEPVERGGWPRWLAARVQRLFDGLSGRLLALRAWFSRWQALHSFGVAFDPLAPFEVRFEDDRLELRLSPRAERAERVRGTSIYLMQPGSAIVVARGGRLLSHAGEVDVRSRAR